MKRIGLTIGVLREVLSEVLLRFLKSDFLKSALLKSVDLTSALLKSALLKTDVLKSALLKNGALKSGMLLLLVVLGAGSWYFVSPLLLNRTADETLPFATPAVGFLASQAKAASQFPANDEIGVIMPPTAAVLEKAPTATVTQTVGVNATTSTPILLGQGQFVDGDNFHKAVGVATLYQAPDNRYLLRFDDFAATNGPDLHVLLSPNTTLTDYASLGEYLDLGALTGNIGDQNYTLPADFDPTQYKSVVIYCLPFKIIFATAILE